MNEQAESRLLEYQRLSPVFKIFCYCLFEKQGKHTAIHWFIKCLKPGIQSISPMWGTQLPEPVPPPRDYISRKLKSRTGTGAGIQQLGCGMQASRQVAKSLGKTLAPEEVLNTFPLFQQGPPWSSPTPGLSVCLYNDSIPAGTTESGKETQPCKVQLRAARERS